MNKLRPRLNISAIVQSLLQWLGLKQRPSKSISVSSKPSRKSLTALGAMLLLKTRRDRRQNLSKPWTHGKKP